MASKPETAETAGNAKNGESDSRAATYSLILNWIFLGFILLALGSVFCYAETLRAAATAWLWAFACLAVGTFVGLLFGVQREQNPPGQVLEKDKPRVQEEQKSDRLPNNNLIDISDWLTKIIVGVGLVELKQVPARMKTIAGPLSACLGGECGLAIAVAVVVFFAFVGFLIGYINSRTFLRAMFSIYDDLDFQALQRTSVENKRKIEQLDKQRRIEELAQRAMNAIWMPKDDPSYKTALKEQLNSITEFISHEQTSAELGFQRARLLRRLERMPEAVAQLKTTYSARRNANIPEDDKDATLLFNTACYLNVIADEHKAANDQIGSENLRSEAWEAIKKAVHLDPANLDLATSDADLKTLTQSAGRSWESLKP